MRIFLPSLFFILFFVPNVIAQKNGDISGLITSSDAKAATNITVQLNGTSMVTVTDKNGAYHFDDVRYGKYILRIKCVGIQTEEKNIVVNSKKLAVNFRLKEDHQQLLEVQVNAGLINKYANKESESVARLPLKNLENPQVYSIISKELLKEQGATDFKVAFKNVPGVIATAAPNGATYIRSRGFYTGVNLRNGLAVQQFTGIDLINVERIEILKGPAGTLFGSSLVSYGGLVNKVTKKPLDTLKGEINYSLGSWNQNRLTADINTPLNKEKTLLFRINAAAHYQHSFQDYGFERSIAVTPSLSYKVNKKLAVLVDAEFYKVNRVASVYHQFGTIPTKNFNDLKLNYNQSLTTDETMGKQGSTNLYGQVDYQISKNWKSATSIAYSHSQWDDLTSVYAYWLTDTTLRRSINMQRPRTLESYNIQQNFTGLFTTAGLKHRFVTGLDAYLFHTQYEFYAAKDYDIVNINKPAEALSMPRINTMMGAPFLYKTRQNQYAAYFSDVISLADRWFAMLSLRADFFDSKGTTINDAPPAPVGIYDQTALSHKLGLVYQPVKGKVSLFVNYMNGFQNVAPIAQPDGVIAGFKPQHANQWEGGVKLDVVNHKLNATLSYYNTYVTNSIRRDNVTRINGLTGFAYQDGSQRSKGVEAEVIANPIAGLNILAGYGYNDSKFIRATSAEGNRTATSPQNVANTWVSYKLIKGVAKGAGIGAGANYVGKSYWDITNVFVVPSYTMLDASVFYDRPKWNLGLKMNNITREKAWDINGVPFMRAQLIANMGYKF